MIRAPTRKPAAALAAKAKAKKPQIKTSQPKQSAEPLAKRESEIIASSFANLDMLSVPERQAIMDYKQFGYSDINGLLRGGKVDDPKQVHKDIAGIDAIMGQFALREPVTVYRALKGTPVAKDAAFMSTSLDKKKAINSVATMRGADGMSVLEMHVPAGTRAIYLDHPAFRENYGGGGGYEFPREYELLLDRGLPFKITGSHKEGGITVYEADVQPTNRPVQTRAAPQLNDAQKKAAEEKAIGRLNKAQYFPEYAEALYAMIRLKPVSAQVHQAIGARVTQLLDAWTNDHSYEQTQQLTSMLDAADKLGSNDPSVAAALVGYLKRTPVDKWLFVDNMVAQLPKLVRGDAKVKAELRDVAKKIEQYKEPDAYLAKKLAETGHKLAAMAA
jgi:hypothetical protein